MVIKRPSPILGIFLVVLMGVILLTSVSAVVRNVFAATQLKKSEKGFAVSSLTALIG